MVGEWDYGGGVYEVRSEGEKLFFHEGEKHGELLVDGEWRVATLQDGSGKEVGMIRLKEVPGRLPLQIAGSVGASEMIKSMVFEANPGVVEGVTLHEVVEGGWGESAVASILKADPEVTSPSLILISYRLITTINHVP